MIIFKFQVNENDNSKWLKDMKQNTKSQKRQDKQHHDQSYMEKIWFCKSATLNGNQNKKQNRKKTTKRDSKTHWSISAKSKHDKTKHGERQNVKSWMKMCWKKRTKKLRWHEILEWQCSSFK